MAPEKGQKGADWHLTDMNNSQHVTELYEQGFTVLPEYFEGSKLVRMREIMDAEKERAFTGTESSFGFTIHPMMPRVPDMAPFLDAPEAIDILAEAFRDEVRLVHLGARISGPQSSPRIGWHHHYPWDTEGLLTRDRMERILIGVYVDGSTPESGRLVALPRRYNDPIGEAPAPGARPDEKKVDAPPGSIVLFDTALWHDAERGTGTGTRRLWGTHCQGWSETRPHGEDNEVDAPQIAHYKAQHPRLKALIER